MALFVPRSAEQIEQIVEEGWSESSTLEFKSSKALNSGNRDRFADDLAKDVSAFANAGGGAIIVGIEENNHRAQSVEGCSNEKIDELWFESVILSKVSPVISGLEVVMLNHRTGRVAVIAVPSSLVAPHAGPDRRYYARRQLRTDVLDPHELDLLRLRGEARNDLVFGGIVVVGGLVLAVVENGRQTPIYDVRISIPQRILESIKYQKKILAEGLAAVGAKSNLQSLLDSVYTGEYVLDKARVLT